MYLKPKVRRRLIGLSLSYVSVKYLLSRGLGRQLGTALGMDGDQGDITPTSPSFSRRVASAEAHLNRFPYSG